MGYNNRHADPIVYAHSPDTLANLELARLVEAHREANRSKRESDAASVAAGQAELDAFTRTVTYGASAAHYERRANRAWVARLTWAFEPLALYGCCAEPRLGYE